MTFTPVDKSATYSQENPIAAERAKRDLLELSIGYGLILLVVWTPLPGQRLFFWFALAWVVLVTCVSFDGLSAMGLRASGFLRSLWVVGIAILFAALAVTLADKFHTAHIPGSLNMLIKRYWGYAIWAFFQEFLLLDFFLLRLLRLLRDRKAAVIAAAGLFTVAHLPNPILTLATLIWGFAASLLFLRYRNLYTLAISHVIFGVCVAVTVPVAVSHSMKVGLGYLRYRPPAITAIR